MLIVKKIFRYLIKIQNLDLWYSKRTSIDLIGYFDTDYDGCKIEEKKKHKWHMPISWVELNLLV